MIDVLIYSKRYENAFRFSNFNIFFYKCIGFSKSTGKIVLIIYLTTSDFSDARSYRRSLSWWLFPLPSMLSPPYHHPYDSTTSLCSNHTKPITPSSMDCELLLSMWPESCQLPEGRRQEALMPFESLDATDLEANVTPVFTIWLCELWCLS